jgi:DNA-binding NarL/FixJ family response regulator
MNGGEAVQLAEELRPDVVLLDISMPVMTGLDAARLIRERLPDVRIILVSNHTTAAYIDEAFSMGVHGYVVKGSATLQLPRAIKDVLDGRIFRAA